MIGWKLQKELIRHEINRHYTPMQLSYKKLQKETLSFLTSLFDAKLGAFLFDQILKK